MIETHALPTRTSRRKGVHIRLPDGSSVELSREFTVGTSEVCDVVLTDRTVSRRHALISPTPFGARVRDQDSRNGTFFESARVGDIEVPVGAEIRLGATTLTFVEAEVSAKETLTIHRLGRFVGAAPALQPIYEQLNKAILSDSTILIEGESGTGKELLSEAVHQGSARSDGPFVVVDCGAMAETLVESTLFGHERGAFTGAGEARVGAFEQADGGTVFLDEIGELPLKLQTRLLRFLDRREVRPVGSKESRSVDVRVVAATNRDLEREVERGTFRLDLYHRLAVVYVRVPPLRDRPSDLALLARRLVSTLGGDPSQLTKERLERIRERRWSGNVRELRNYLERWLLLGDGREGELREADSSSDDPARGNLPYRQARALALEAFTQVYVENMLARHDGNVSHAAEAAGVARRYFQRLKSKPSS